MSQTLFVLLLLILMVELFSAVIAHYESCTINGKVGNCVLIQNCPALYALSQDDTFTSKSLNILLNFQCGYVGIIPKVCCENNTELSSLNFDTGNQITPRSSLLPDYKDCGLSLIDDNSIYGGKLASIKEFPWLALLFYKDLKYNYITYSCGGALISKRYVLTAAHCVKGNIKDEFELKFIRLGEYNISATKYCDSKRECHGHTQDIGFEEIIPHPAWVDDASRHNDIALVRLNRDVAFSPLISPICLPNKGRKIITSEEKLKGYSYLRVAGWGVTEVGKKSDIKMKVSIPVRPLYICQKKYRKHLATAYLNKHIQICAGGETYEDSCKGDSGGPAMSLHIDSEGREVWFSTGIVSFGPNPCATTGYPAVYTRTNAYIDWILSNMRP